MDHKTQAIKAAMDQCHIADDTNGNDDSLMDDSEAIEPKLTKSLLQYGLRTAMCLKTVLINPMRKEIFEIPEFGYLLANAASYKFKQKNRTPGPAVLVYDTINKGEDAFITLKQKVKDMDTEISHPPFPNEWRCFWPKGNIVDEEDGRLMDDTNKYSVGIALFSRLIILKKLPAEINIDEKLVELFPEAINHISFEFSKSAQGIALLEFATTEEANTLVNNCLDVPVELEVMGTKIQASKGEHSLKWLSDIMEFKGGKKFNKKNKKDDNKEDKKVTPQKVKSEGSPTKPLRDAERLDLVKKLNEKNAEMMCANDVDKFGMEKIILFHEIFENFKEDNNILFRDTARRMKAGEKSMPEPEELMFENIKALVQRAKDKTDKKTEKVAQPQATGESKQMTKLKEFARQHKKAFDDLHRLEGILFSMEGQILTSEKPRWDLFKVEIGLNFPVFKRKGITASTPVLAEKLTKEQQLLIQETQKKNAAATKNLMKDLSQGKIKIDPAMKKAQGGFGRGGVQRGRGGFGRGNMGRGGRGRGDLGPGGRGRGDFGGRGRGFNQWSGKRQGGYEADEPEFKRSHMSGSAGPMAFDMIEGMAESLNNKMRQLETMQQQTLQTQKALLEVSKRQISSSLGGPAGPAGRGSLLSGDGPMLDDRRPILDDRPPMRGRGMDRYSPVGRGYSDYY